MQRSAPADTADAHPGRSVAASVGIVVLATTVYYLLPVPGRMRQASWALLFSCGVVVLGLLILLAIRRLIRAGEDVRISGLVQLLVLTVLFFSWCDDSVAMLPGQFVDLHTKTDALYFTISTLATVGFGDVHAAGQLARTAVTVQIVFNLVFIGAGAGIVSRSLRSRAASRLRTHDEQDEPRPGDQDGAR